jgi:methionyl-tRNA formyltransferase
LKLGVAATAPFGADVLERLAGHFDLAFLLTRPDRPKGRGLKLAAPPAKQVAERLDGTVELPADVIVVAAYGLLIPESLLAHGLWLNVHPSLLPRWRGAAPVERAILAGDEETGVTIHETVKELDAGPICAQRPFPVGEDAGAVFAQAAQVAVELIVASLPEPDFAPQPEDGVTYAAKITAEDRELDLSDPEDALRRIRALSPHIGARAELHGRRVLVWRARIDGGELVPLEVQPEGRRRMSYEEFLRGVR